MSRLRRLRRPCEVSGTATFTDLDLTFSPAIRNISQQVINHVLKKPRPKNRAGSRGWARTSTARGGGGGGNGDGVVEGGQGREQEQGQEQEPAERVIISRVQVHKRKLAVEGKVKSMEPYLRFRCEVSLSAPSDGRVLRFMDPSFFWETPKGYVPLPMPPLQPFDIDLGDR